MRRTACFATVAAALLLAGCGSKAAPTATVEAAPEPVAVFEPAPERAGTRWLKGNTHTHTTRSDGDSEPEVVAQWYKDHGYDFLVLTDHNKLTDPSEGKVGDEKFLLIPGEEVSATFRTPFETKPVHVNGLDVKHVVTAVNDGKTIGEVIQNNVDAINDADGLPHVNHPNFRWAFNHEALMTLERCNLLEIYNGHPEVNNAGDAEHEGLEAMWDILLTNKKHVFGIAVDDAHHFKGEFKPERSNPGRAWIMVRSPKLEKDAILHAIETGNFYFTTGVTLADVVVAKDRYEIQLGETASPRTEFIGRGGEVLLETTSNPAVYRLKGGELYVRAKVHDANGKAAWTQPFFVQ